MVQYRFGGVAAFGRDDAFKRTEDERGDVVQFAEIVEIGPFRQSVWSIEPLIAFRGIHGAAVCLRADRPLGGVHLAYYRDELAEWRMAGITRFDGGIGQRTIYWLDVLVVDDGDDDRIWRCVRGGSVRAAVLVLYDVFRSFSVRAHLRHGVVAVGRDLPRGGRVLAAYQEGEAAHDEHEFPAEFAKAARTVDGVLDGDGKEVFAAVPIEAEYAVFAEGGDHSVCDRPFVGSEFGVSERPEIDVAVFGGADGTVRVVAQRVCDFGAAVFGEGVHHQKWFGPHLHAVTPRNLQIEEVGVFRGDPVDAQSQESIVSDIGLFVDIRPTVHCVV